MRLDLAIPLHFPNRDVRQFLVGPHAFPHRLRWDAEGEGGFYFILCDDSSYACHYLFDSFGREKVVPSAVGACLFDDVPDCGRGAADPNGDIGDANSAIRLRRQHKAQPLKRACRQSIELSDGAAREWAATGVRIDNDSATDRP